MLASLIVKTLVFYKKKISPIFVLILGNACRFTPTCSEYAVTAFTKHGVVKGLALSTRRLIRCHPFSQVAHDPVP